ncbi:MAG: DUF6036 family nucleotidyltransferase [Eggerthellaceae bacterium]|nr:DUF6036 family nucleotidyltransferase [Eggerthellaceae bacterium]
MNKETLTKQLQELDENAQIILGIPKRKYSVIIIGGAAFLLNDLTSRGTTYDIDVFFADNAIRGILGTDPNLNFQCGVFSENIPYNYEDRLQKLPIHTKVIDYYSPSPEDLAVLKLFRWQDRDIQDLTNPQFLEKLDWELLDRLVNDPDEIRASRIPEAAKDRALSIFLENYLQYRKGFINETRP